MSKGYGSSWKEDGDHHDEDPEPEKKQKDLTKWVGKDEKNRS